MSDWGVNLIRTMNMDPTFKGGMVVIVSALALLFAFWMKKRWREPLGGSFLLFIFLAAFCFLFGLFIMVLQPQWWKPPY